MFQLNLILKAHPKQAAEVVQALRHIVTWAKIERGFIASRIYQSIGDPELICFEEDWLSEPLFQSHVRSSCFTNLLMLMETSREMPLLEVRSIGEVHGLEYIDAVRFGKT